MLKKIFFVLTLTISSIINAFALPGVDQYLSDTSGEYVYYKDNSFSHESYIGFVYYSDEAYGARYYAPAVISENKPAKDISLLLSVNSNADFMEFTGEKILTSLTPEDTDIVNYLHDVMYEFAARRKKIGELSPKNVAKTAKNKSFMERGYVSEEDYQQFGGNVKIYFDYLVPIFNLRKIVSDDGTLMLEAITAGRLVSSQDSSFADFSGFPETLVDSGKGAKISTKGSENQSLTLKGSTGVLQTVELDTLWKPAMQNLWFLENKASAAVSLISVPKDFGGNEKFLETLKRQLILGTQGSYSVWKKLTITDENSKLSVTSYYYQPAKQNLTRDVKIISEMTNSEYGFFNLTTFDSDYRKNHKYFDKIVKSCKISK